MNKWNVLFYLNSGNQVEGVYEGHETNSLEVAKNILSDSSKSNKFFDIRVDATKPTQGFVKIDDVSAFLYPSMKVIKNHKNMVIISIIMLYNVTISNITNTKIDDKMKVLLS